MQASGSLSSPAAPRRSFQTDAQGNYAFASLPYGHYQLEVSATGFAPAIAVRRELGHTGRADSHHGVGHRHQQTRCGFRNAARRNRSFRRSDSGPVQTATAEDMTSSGAANLTELMNRRLNGVFLNDMEGNSFQADVNFRWLHGLAYPRHAEGISVYVDGVRQNQPFGDVVAGTSSPKTPFPKSPSCPLRPALRPQHARRRAARATKDASAIRRFHYRDLWRKRP